MFIPFFRGGGAYRDVCRACAVGSKDSPRPSERLDDFVPRVGAAYASRFEANVPRPDKRAIKPIRLNGWWCLPLHRDDTAEGIHQRPPNRFDVVDVLNSHRPEDFGSVLDPRKRRVAQAG
jgi:hypothetical protein